MESSEPTPSAEELELKEFNDPFDVVSDNYIRQRRAEIDFEPISQEDDEKLAHMLDSMPIEDSLIHDAFSRMISMNLVSAEIANQVQEDFDFEKLDFTAAPALSSAEMEHINHLTEELEIEEAISLIESGIDEDGTPLTEERIAEVEQRILRLDSLIRRRKKNTSNAKDR